MVCIAFSDGYHWPVADSIAGWEMIGSWEGKAIEVARGFQADYYHISGTSYVRKEAKCQAGGKPGPNLLQNPGFEAMFTGWHSTRELTPGDSVSFGADAAVYRSGAHSARGTEVAIGNLGRLFQDVSQEAKAGRCYRIGGWIKTQDVQGNVVIGLDYVNAIGVTPAARSYVKEVGYVSGTQGWTYFESEPFVLPPMPIGSGDATLWFLLDFNNGSGSSWWDDLHVVEIGPPPLTPPGTGEAGLAAERR